MNDVVSIFPTADEIRNEGIERFSLYLFEEEIRSIFRLIVWAKSRGFSKVQATELSANCIEFLIDKGYVIKDGDSLEKVWVSWET